MADRLVADGEDVEHTRKACQLHKLLLELIPGGAKTFLSAAQAKDLLRKVRPTTPAGKVRKAHALELTSDLATIYARTKAADNELKAPKSRHGRRRVPTPRAAGRRAALADGGATGLGAPVHPPAARRARRRGCELDGYLDGRP